MKKNMIRILALALVLLLALGILPLGALAATLELHEDAYHSQTPTKEDMTENSSPLDPANPTKTFDTAVTIKASEYENLIWYNDELYELKGFVTEEDVSKLSYSDLLQFKSSLTFDGKTDLTAYLGYALHSHALSYWYYDGTTHWRECMECGDQFMFQNWHCDGDEDRVCDVCHVKIPYHDITVIDSEGGKIVVNEETAPHRRKITATVEVADGYELKDIHFIKIRDDGTRQEITQWLNRSGDVWTLMPTYDLEISAEFEKK